jgi:hypothetical protein
LQKQAQFLNGPFNTILEAKLGPEFSPPPTQTPSVVAAIASVKDSMVSLRRGRFTPAPSAATRSAQKELVGKGSGTTMDGFPDCRAVPAVPAPQWCTTAAMCGNSQA